MKKKPNPLGFSNETLERLRVAGCPVDDEGQARAWLAIRLAARERARAASDDRWREGRAQRAMTAAQRERHTLAILREKWVERDEVELRWGVEVSRVRDALLALPERCAHTDAETIRAEINRALDGLAAGSKRLTEEDEA